MAVLLESVDESSLISLSVRALESGREKRRLEDSTSSMVLEKSGLDSKKYDSFFVHENMVAAARIIEKAACDFVEGHPDSVVVNLGCGYDCFFGKADNGKIFWYDVDLPEVMERRRNIFSSGERFMELEGSALEQGWTVFITKEKEPLVIAQGLFFHYKRKQISTLLQILTESFAGGHLLCDLWSPWAVSRLEKSYAIKDGRWGEGIVSCDEILGMNGRLSLEKEYLFSQEFHNFGWKSRTFCSGKNKKDSRVALFAWQRTGDF